jgi:hypothetical protein
MALTSRIGRGDTEPAERVRKRPLGVMPAETKFGSDCKVIWGVQPSRQK